MRKIKRTQAEMRFAAIEKRQRDVLTERGQASDVIGEPTFADAILDRLIHNAYRIELDGQSMRKTDLEIGDERNENGY